MEMKNFYVKLMATLWENTYRAVITDQNEQYAATARVIVNIPLPPEALPPNAPQVEAQLLVLVEDGTISPEDLIEFETILAAKIREKFQYEISTVFFYYPSPEDVLNTGTIDQK
ncbi:hypothetical protein [Veillonella criceti]|uniref:Uncharacterized protein n=1 Tax=Veillonella criceti TaxID=103891 RepID=A0A380NHX0_9FIRM|nr:hypothetical protein [Veillonella criceti]SUP40916.1 Uncharacterised protein [Veillonella criceti]